MKLPATLYDQLRDNKILNFIFGKRSKSNDIEVRIPTPNDMVKQSFVLYLESYMTELLADDLDYIKYFKCVTTLFRQHCEVKIMRHEFPRHEYIHGTDKVSNIITTYVLRNVQNILRHMSEICLSLSLVYIMHILFIG